MAADDRNRTPSLDVYAKPFIPQSLKAVNEAPANIIPCAPVRWIDFAEYIRTFAGTAFSKNDPVRSVSYASRQELASHVDLCERTYGLYFRIALQREQEALQLECDDHALWQVPVVRAMNDSRPRMWWLEVPGLRELSLRVEIGDCIHLRQIRYDSNGMAMSKPLITDKLGRPAKGMKPADNQHNAVVWGIDRSRELLVLRIDSLPPRSLFFNVRFTVQTDRLDAMHRAIVSTQWSLHAHADGWMQSMLFPSPANGVTQTSLNTGRFGMRLHDPQLNYEQLKAINTVINEAHGTIPFLISGPPGTGKTKTLVELALQLISKDPSMHLLVCAPSDPAADTLVQRLSRHLTPTELLRLNSPSRNFPEVPNSVLSYCFVDDGMFSLPPFTQLMRTRIVVTACRDADLLVKAGVTNSELYRLEQSLHAAIHPNVEAEPSNLHWTALLMDEAAQATEPEALIPLSVVAPPAGTNSILPQRLPFVVMAGDQNQLGPRTASKSTAIQTSLFERLLSRPLYSEHPLARSKQSGGLMKPLTKEMLPIIRPPFANLIRNYRSHSAILATPSALFYNDTLEPEATDTEGLLSWSGWQGRKWPVLFAVNTGADEIEQDGGGWYNLTEANLACDYASDLLASGLVRAQDVCIMSPFRAQVRVLRKMARERGMSGVNIGPLEAFQGLESRVVILCTTRTRNRFIEQDIAKGQGVIHEPRRFDVALTRAKEGLIVIGNPDVLALDENWAAFVSFCHRNELWQQNPKGSTSFEKPTWLRAQSGRLSRLERQLLHRDELVDQPSGDTADNDNASAKMRRLGLVDDAEYEMWREGVAMEEAMREHGLDEQEDPDSGSEQSESID